MYGNGKNCFSFEAVSTESGKAYFRPVCYTSARIASDGPPCLYGGAPRWSSWSTAWAAHRSSTSRSCTTVRSQPWSTFPPKLSPIRSFHNVTPVHIFTRHFAKPGEHTARMPVGGAPHQPHVCGLLHLDQPPVLRCAPAGWCVLSWNHRLGNVPKKELHSTQC